MNGTKSTRVVAVDVSVLIHHANDDPRFGEGATATLAEITAGKARGVMSVVGVTEYLSLKLPGKSNRTKQRHYTEQLLAWLMSIPNLDVIEITVSTAVKAANLRQRYGFKTPDALHLACAIAAGASEFVTTDKNLRKCKEIRVKSLA